MRASRLTFPGMFLFCTVVFTLLMLFSLHQIAVPDGPLTPLGWIDLVFVILFWSVLFLFTCTLCILVVLFALEEIRMRGMLTQGAAP